ncbi:MAG: acyltransferase family protein [Bulleidia sp.]|nr:acyltransferase family protein [Bulleidia sp.]
MKRATYLDGVKGIACIGVFLYHFNTLFHGQVVNIQFDASSMDFFFGKLIKLFVDGPLLVMIFALVSGWLTAHTNIPTVNSFLKRIFIRYLRFTLPLLPVLLLIRLFSQMHLFYTSEAYELLGIVSFENSIYSLPMNLMEGIRQGLYKILLLRDNAWDAPLWMFSGIFWGSILVYFLTWLKTKINNPNIMALISAVTAFFSYQYWESTSVMVILGAAVYWYEDVLKKIPDWFVYLASALSIMMVYGLHHWLYHWLCMHRYFTPMLDYTIQWRMLYSFILFYAIMRSRRLQSIFSYNLEFPV